MNHFFGDETWLFDKNHAYHFDDVDKVTFANDLRKSIIINCLLMMNDSLQLLIGLLQEQVNRQLSQLKNYCIPKEIAFDHDLGGNDTVINFLNFLPNYFIDNDCKFPEGFKYSIHSQNPVGKENIDAKMKQLLKYFS